MDPLTIGTAYTGLKHAKDMLQALAKAKIDAESLGRVNDALAKLGQAQDTLFEMREELFALQQTNQELRRQVSEQEDWQGKIAGYSLVTTKGGATVLASAVDPRHYICPACVNKRELQILQSNTSFSGTYGCPGCKHTYPIDQRRDPNLRHTQLW